MKISLIALRGGQAVLLDDLGAAAVRCNAPIDEGLSAACLVMFAMIDRLAFLAGRAVHASQGLADTLVCHIVIELCISSAMLPALAPARIASAPNCRPARGRQDGVSTCPQTSYTFRSRCSSLPLLPLNHRRPGILRSCIASSPAGRAGMMDVNTAIYTLAGDAARPALAMRKTWEVRTLHCSQNMQPVHVCAALTALFRRCHWNMRKRSLLGLCCCRGSGRYPRQPAP